MSRVNSYFLTTLLIRGEKDKMNLSTNFKKFRKEFKLEQDQIAKELETNIETIRRIEQGKNKQISLELLEKIVKFFNCSYDDLLK